MKPLLLTLTYLVGIGELVLADDVDVDGENLLIRSG